MTLDVRPGWIDPALARELPGLGIECIEAPAPAALAPARRAPARARRPLRRPARGHDAP
jgi:hypothetical protein